MKFYFNAQAIWRIGMMICVELDKKTMAYYVLIFRMTRCKAQCDPLYFQTGPNGIGMFVCVHPNSASRGF